MCSRVPIMRHVRIRLMLCTVLAAAMVFSASGCGVKNSGETVGPADQSNIPAAAPDGNNSAPVMDEPVESSPPDAAAGGTEADSAESPGSESAPPADPPADDELVRVLDYIPSIYVELKYATEDNFTGTVVYDFADAYLRYGTVRKLAGVQAELLAQGYSLKIWDAYRPVSAQFKLWEICPDPVYVADPNKGYSNHSRGNTVDVTLVLADGTELGMPTGFDDFSALADRDYSDVPAGAAENALILENMMKDHGFNCYSGEWWHYSDSSAYPVVQN